MRIVVFGEVLCDLFAPVAGQPLQTAKAFVPRLGGAPANVAVQAARLGVPAALVSAVGNDPLGARLRDTLVAEGVDTSALCVIDGKRTGATLVEVDGDGERRFFGFREASADLALTPAHVDTPAVRRLLRGAAVLHSGTVSLAADGARAATHALQDAARKAGAIISVDVNLRPGMYPSLDLLLARANEAVDRADVVKATVDEARQLLGVSRRVGAARLAASLLARGPRLVALTDGEQPFHLATPSLTTTWDALATRAVDATGAGDAFFGAVLARLVRDGVGPHDLAALDVHDLERLAGIGRVAGARATTGLGATTKMLRRRLR